MYKIERMIASTGYWYDVMLSPFNTWEEVIAYIKKYRNCYPKEEQNYKVTFLENNIAVP
jgi:hypothetical protein